MTTPATPDSRRMTSSLAGAVAQAHRTPAQREALRDNARGQLRRHVNVAADCLDQTAWEHHLEADALDTTTATPPAPAAPDPARPRRKSR
ncbi:hypothetical protein ACIBK8_25575 [Streptomyces sp. NPDC050161]|uniref:hypothetical protein n=1 Tax=Streptomyces sp. NPDC050161 TaxID=3365604 RepID=UPI003789512B